MNDQGLFLRLRRRLFWFQMLLLLVSACAVAFAAMRTFEADLNPDITRKGELIARSLASQFSRALSFGMPLDRLPGVERLFATLRANNDQFLFIAVGDSDGRVLHVSGAVPPEAVAGAYSQLAAQARQQPADERAISGEAVLGQTVIGQALIQEPVIGGPASGEPAIDQPVIGEAAAAGQQADPLRLDGQGAEPWAERQAALALPFLTTVQPIVVLGATAGWVMVGFDANYVQQRITEVLYDVLVVLLVSLLVTFELVLLIMASATAPAAAVQTVIERLRRRYAALSPRAAALAADSIAHRSLEAARTALDALAGRAFGGDAGAQGQVLVRVRMPLFVFFTAEELSRPFFPVFARDLCAALPGVDPDVAVSVPMTLFLLVVALLQPFAGPWAQRMGARRLLLAGALAVAAGLALTATAESFATLLAWRLLTAFGYGLVFVAGQSHVVQNTQPANRAWGLAMFVGSVLAASICGPALGGLLADGIGQRPTFVVGAALALLAAWAAQRLLPAAAPVPGGAARGLRWADVAVLSRNHRFVALVVLAAMPAKIILTGFLYYLAPLFLTELGASSASAGRTMMLYGLMMVLATPLTARLVDRFGHPLRFVILGGLLSAAGLAVVVLVPGIESMVLAIVLLGVAQAASVTPQLSLVPVACTRECQEVGQITVIGFFRLGERIGSAMGPALAALLLHAWGIAPTIAVIAGASALGCVALGLTWSGQRGGTASPGQRCDLPLAQQAPTK